MSDWNEITITLRYRPAVLEKGEGYSRDEPRTELELVQEEPEETYLSQEEQQLTLATTQEETLPCLEAQLQEQELLE